MAKWYYIEDDTTLSAYNMEWFREVTMDVTRFSGDKEESWCLRFEYAVTRQGEENHEVWTCVKTVYTEFDIMKALYDKVIEWLQSPAAPAVFYQKQTLEEYDKEREGEVQC